MAARLPSIYAIIQKLVNIFARKCNLLLVVEPIVVVRVEVGDDSTSLSLSQVMHTVISAQTKTIKS